MTLFSWRRSWGPDSTDGALSDDEGASLTIEIAMRNPRNALRRLAARAGRSKLLGAFRIPAQHGLLPWSMLARIPLSQDFHVQVPGGDGYRYLCVEHDRLGRRLYWMGFPQHEPETLPIFALVASRSDQIVDVGANTGVYSLTACSVNPEAHVTAIEAVSPVANRLIVNGAANGWSNRLRVVVAAASDSVGSAAFATPRQELPRTARLASVCCGTDEDVDVAEVAMVTVDEVMNGRPPVDLVKIDVEGAEDQVLAGMTRILREDRPVIFTEALAFESEHIGRVSTILSAAGYRFWRISRAGVYEQPCITPDPTRVERNYLCVPADRVTAVQDIIGMSL